MTIRMLIGIAGTDFALSPGEETERFSDGEAERMIAAGMAEAVDKLGPQSVSVAQSAPQPAAKPARKAAAKKG